MKNLYLLIIAPVRIVGGRSVYNVSYGSRVAIECNARGEPPPKITFWNEARPVRTQFFFLRAIDIQWIYNSFWFTIILFS
jgi:hypothetical protein